MYDFAPSVLLVLVECLAYELACELSDQPVKIRRMRCEVCGKMVADDGSDGHFHDVPTFDGSEV